MSFSVRADRRLIRAEARSRRFIRIELAAPEAPPRKDRIPVNLAFVLDRSGSMAGDKIEKAREAAVQGIRALWPEDRFAVVAYDQQVDVVVPTTLATAEAKADAEDARPDDRRPRRAPTSTAAGPPAATRSRGRSATTRSAAASC